MECTYCKKSYPTNASLHAHQKRSKSCITIQKEMGIETILHKCEYCDGKFSINNKANHYKHCIAKRDKELEDAKKEICSLKKHIADYDEQTAMVAKLSGLLLEKDKKIRVLSEHTKRLNEKGGIIIDLSELKIFNPEISKGGGKEGDEKR